MEISTVQWANAQHDAVIVNGQYHVPVITDNRHWVAVEQWINGGNMIASELPEPPPPTNAELVEMAGPVLLAFIKAYAQREGLTLAQVRDAIVANM